MVTFESVAVERTQPSRPHSFHRQPPMKRCDPHSNIRIYIPNAEGNTPICNSSVWLFLIAERHLLSHGLQDQENRPEAQVSS